MTREQLEKQARLMLERRRQEAETRAIRRREEIDARLPELRSLERQQGEAGATAARLATEGRHADAELHLAEVQSIKRRKLLLLSQHGYSEEDLRPAYSCPNCKDSGRLPSGKSCECYRREIGRLRREEINANGPLRLCSFDTFRLDVYPEQMEGVAIPPRQHMGRVYADMKEYAETFGRASNSLLLYGDAGLGKTHLALAVANEVLGRGFDVIYVSAQSAFAQIAGERFNGGGEILRSMVAADLLVLDDLGTEFLDAYVLSCLYEVVNGRLNRKPTIYTTNICSQNQILHRYTEKVASRLLGECTPVRFFGRDIRTSKQL